MGPRAALFTMVEHTLLPCTTVLAKCTRLARKRRPHLYRASRMPVQRYASCPNLVSCRGYLKIAQLAYQKELSRPLTYETQHATYEIHQQSWMRRNSRASLQCKVTKSCHRNVMGCEDQNLIKALWRSQAPLQSLCIHLASV